MAALYWLGFNCLKARQPLREDAYFFNSKSPGVPDTHLVDLTMIKG